MFSVAVVGLLWSGSLAVHGVPADQTYCIRLADGSEKSGGPAALDPRKGVSLPGGESWSLEQIVELRFPGQGALPSVPPSAAVHLHDGSFLVGAAIGGDDLHLVFELPGGPRAPINVDALYALFLGDGAERRDLALYTRRGETDILYRRRGGTRADFTTGTLLAFGEGELEFNYSLGDGSFPLSEVEGLILSMQLDLPDREGVQVDVDLWPDGSIQGEWVEIDANHLSLRPLFAEEALKIPRSSVRGLRPRGGTHRWLSDVDASRVVETPFIGGDDLFLFPYRRDRSVTGQPLQVAGRRYAKGLGCHARTRLEYDLAALGSPSRFVADVGVADEVLGLADRGAVQFVVLLDGTEVARTSTLRAGDAAVRVGPIQLQGHSTMTLLTDFAEGGDVADRAVWGSPLLFR